MKFSAAIMLAVAAASAVAMPSTEQVVTTYFIHGASYEGYH